jgi:hypothetical protein
LELNVPYLDRPYDAPAISFSHFLPRAELMFDLDRDGQATRSKRGSEDPFNFSGRRHVGARRADPEAWLFRPRIRTSAQQPLARYRWCPICLALPGLFRGTGERPGSSLKQRAQADLKKEGVPKETQDY